jgi:signal transduction histidine kinase
MLDDLLDYATADNRPLTTEAVDLSGMVTDIITERTLTWTGEQRPVIIAGPLPTVAGDPTLLRQVFDNLIGNAIKYTHHGRTPHVEITAEQNPLEDVWRIEVSDHGIGIPAEQRGTVFTAFTRASGSEGYPGTGLGLAIVHRIIERHHGHIGVTGNDHGGSLFWIVLPATAAIPDDTLSEPDATSVAAGHGPPGAYH